MADQDLSLTHLKKTVLVAQKFINYFIFKGKLGDKSSHSTFGTIKHKVFDRHINGQHCQVVMNK